MDAPTFAYWPLIPFQIRLVPIMTSPSMLIILFAIVVETVHSAQKQGAMQKMEFNAGQNPVNQGANSPQKPKGISAEVWKAREELAKQFSKYCQPYSATTLSVPFPFVWGPMKPLKTVDVAWNLPAAFEQATLELGRGSFGVVKEVCFPFHLLENKNYGMQFPDQIAGPVAVKRVMLTSLEVGEMEVMYLLTAYPDSPRFYGCMIDENLEYAYILQTRLQASLKEAKPAFRQSANMQGRWDIYRKLWVQSALIYKLGYVHNDIKAPNTMLFEAGKKLAIIDYGMAQKKGTRRQCAGSPIFMPFTKCQANPGIAQLRDDLYSVAVTMFEMEYSTNSFSPLHVRYLGPDHEDNILCSRKDQQPACRLHVHGAIMKLLAEVYPKLFVGRSTEYVEKTHDLDKMDMLDLISATLGAKEFDPDFGSVIRIANAFMDKVKKAYPATPAIELVPNAHKLSQCSDAAAKKSIYDQVANAEQVAAKKLAAFKAYMSSVDTSNEQTFGII